MGEAEFLFLLTGLKWTVLLSLVGFIGGGVFGLAVALRELAGRKDTPLHRRQAGQRTVVVYLCVVVLVSVFYYPVWTGMSVPYEFWLIHNWLPGWI